MSRKKPKNKHNIRKRLRTIMKGSVIIFDGNDKNQLKYLQPSGLPMGRNMLDCATQWQWRWKITIGLICRFNESVRRPSEEILVNQACCINDLTDFVKERHEIMCLEQPSSWKVEAQIWTVEIIGG